MTPTGTIEQRDGQHVLVQTREFRAPDRGRLGGGDRARAAGALDRQLGGRPGVGQRAVPDAVRGRGARGRGDGDPGLRAAAPAAPDLRVGEEVWLLELDLTHADGVTTLTFAQPGVTAEQVGAVGPGWDYYLDRLVDVETGADPALRDFERDYYPSTAAHYTEQF